VYVWKRFYLVYTRKTTRVDRVHRYMGHVSHIPTYMSHVSHMNESCPLHVWMHMKESCPFDVCMIARKPLSHVPCVKESCPKYTHIYGSCLTYERVMSSSCTNYVPQINLNRRNLMNPRSTSNQSSKSCTVLQYPSQKHINESHVCMMSHISLSHVPCINESCPTHEWITSHT